MKHSIAITCECEAMPRILEFLENQTGKPDDKYIWKESERVECQEGITWGFTYEDLRDKNYYVACFNTEHYKNLSDAVASGALYLCQDRMDGIGQAYDANSIVRMVKNCLGGNIQIVFGMKGSYVWHSTQ